MYIYICIHIYKCSYIHIYTYACINIHVCIYMYHECDIWCVVEGAISVYMSTISTCVSDTLVHDSYIVYRIHLMCGKHKTSVSDTLLSNALTEKKSDVY